MTLSRLLVWSSIMMPKPYICTAIVCVVLLFAAEPADAFRCGSKLVKEGMHELEVVAICGEPTSVQHLGYGIRSVGIRAGKYAAPGWTVTRPYGRYAFPQEVRLTESVYNLGPRKLMRRLVFEGGILAEIETLGRGYIER